MKRNIDIVDKVWWAFFVMLHYMLFASSISVYMNAQKSRVDRWFVRGCLCGKCKRHQCWRLCRILPLSISCLERRQKRKSDVWVNASNTGETYFHPLITYFMILLKSLSNWKNLFNTNIFKMRNLSAKLSKLMLNIKIFLIFSACKPIKTPSFRHTAFNRHPRTLMSRIIKLEMFAENRF